jgi:hypothetical protein
VFCKLRKVRKRYLGKIDIHWGNFKSISALCIFKFVAMCTFFERRIKMDSKHRKMPKQSLLEVVFKYEISNLIWVHLTSSHISEKSHLDTYFSS